MQALCQKSLVCLAQVVLVLNSQVHYTRDWVVASMLPPPLRFGLGSSKKGWAKPPPCHLEPHGFLLHEESSETLPALGSSMLEKAAVYAPHTASGVDLDQASSGSERGRSSHQLVNLQDELVFLLPYRAVCHFWVETQQLAGSQ